MLDKENNTYQSYNMILILLNLAKKNLQRLFFLLFILFAMPAFSLTVHGLYDAQVPIDDQSNTQVATAKKLGIAQVLVKVTGQTQSLNNARVRAAINNAEAYLDHFSFATKMLNDESQAVLKLAFNPSQINELIRQSKLPIWGKDRAAVLVWLVEEQQGVRQIINDNSHPMVAQIMLQAQQRGMPLLWPLLDLEDQVAIDGSALWGLFRETIVNASSRYQADAVLVGRLFQDQAQQWHVEWNFWLDGAEQQWSSEGADLVDLVSPMQDRLTSSLVAKFALIEDDPSASLGTHDSAIIKVEQVTDFEDYVQLQALLANLDGVEKLQLYSANGSTLAYRVFAQSNLSQVKLTLDLKRRLRAVDDAALLFDSEVEPVWLFKWH